MLDRLVIKSKSLLSANKRGDEHDEGTFGEMEIGQEVGDPLKRIARMEEQIALPFGLAGAGEVFDGAGDGGAHGQQGGGISKDGSGGVGDMKRFGVHGVVEDGFGFDRLEGTGPHMEGQGVGRMTRLHRSEEFWGEME